MTVSVQALAAELTREVAETLIAVASATPEERLNWQPLDNGRTILDQLVECTLANRKWTNILRSRRYADLGRAAAEQVYAELDTLSKVVPRLRETAADLAAAIEAVPDAVLAQTVETPWGPYTLARSCTHAYWNMVYHEGQINYIQTLYGDFDEHDPE
ncbi:MAG TPA: DinB family protein [Chthonomonadaceae bacterium]|nr:DinB family protein [Chthonomonadaceae bacterium]